LDFIPAFSGMNFFGLMEMIGINICLPLGTLLLALFVGWRLPRYIAVDELQTGNIFLINVWFVCMRYVVPPTILLIMYFGLVE
jgi:NSS family neurotransmitter:Na+ symporter